MKVFKLYLLSVFLFAFSCKKESVESVNIEANARILLMDNQSRNLLAEPIAIDINNINIYYVINGKQVLQNNGNLDYPKSFRIINDQDGENVLDVFLNNSNEPMPVTLVSFGNSDVDTIRCEYRREKLSVICTKIWYNNDLKYDVKMNMDRKFSVIK